MDQVAERLAELRERRALTLRELSDMSGVAADTINQIELGHRKARPSTLRKLARALEIDVQEFYAEPALPKVEAPREAGPHGKEAKPPASDTPEEQAAEPLSPKQRRFAASARIATLERTFQHLTLRIETLRDQAKTYYEAGDREGLRSVWMDYFLLARGADSLVADIREEVKELGGETKKERRLIGRLVHRTEDLEDVGDQIKNMLSELPSLEGSEERAESQNLYEVDFVRRRRRAS